MSCERVSRKEILEKISVLKTVVGRSDDLFRFVRFSNGLVSAWDGCLKVSLESGIYLNSISIPLDPLFSILKSCDSDEVEICESGDVRCGSFEMRVERLEGRFEGIDIWTDLGYVEDPIEGLDFVSRGLEEGDMIEIHLGKRVFSVSSTGGMVVFYEMEGDSRRWSFSIPYQSTRRFVKALKGMKGWKVGSSGKEAVFENEKVLVGICGEEVWEPISLPKVRNPVKLPEVFRKAVSRGAEVIKGEAVVKADGRKIEVIGKRAGVSISVKGEMDFEIPFSINVNLRKFRSYLSAMNTILIDVEGGVVRFVDGRMKRYVVTRNVL